MVDIEPAGRADDTYRVAVAHTEADHPSSSTAHWGPAYDSAYADVAGHVKGIPAAAVDLLAEALTGAARARDEYSGMDGYEVWVERLTDGEWERVG